MPHQGHGTPISATSSDQRSSNRSSHRQCSCNKTFLSQALMLLEIEWNTRSFVIKRYNRKKDDCHVENKSTEIFQSCKLNIYVSQDIVKMFIVIAVFSLWGKRDLRRRISKLVSNFYSSDFKNTSHILIIIV